MSKLITAVIIGCGARGKDTYAPAQDKFPDRIKIVAAADIDPVRLKDMQEKYGVKPENCFNSGEELLGEPKLADIAFICTQDRQHAAHAVAAMQKGYHIVLEKPISPTLEGCLNVLNASIKYDRKGIVCHVLRYTPFYRKIKDIIDSGAIGEVVNIQALENVGYWHIAHSFVRGNWNREETTSPMILAKSCHDTDILLWLAGKKCKSVSSFGSRQVFKAENAPKGSAKRCLDCNSEVKAECPYNAEYIYIDHPTVGVVGASNTGWPCSVLTHSPTKEAITEALKSGAYGRCVYHCDNDVVDHQVLNMELVDGSTISFNMSGFTSKTQRTIKVMGTHGDIEGDMNTNIIELCQFGKEREIIDVTKLTDDFSGHGGGDIRMVEEFLNLVSGEHETSSSLSTLDVSVDSHLVALAAEISRKNGGSAVTLDSIRG